jgi:phosphate transport system permease protein
VRLGVLIGTPIGIAAGTWLAEYAQPSQARHRGPLRQRHPAVGAVDRAGPVRLHGLVVMQMGGNFSAIAGALALAFIVLPVVVRTTDEMLRLVPVADARSGVVAGRAAVEGHDAGAVSAARCRHRHRRAAGPGAHQRRDRAAAVHRLQQPVLEPDLTGAMANVPVVIFQYRDEPVRELATRWPGPARFMVTLFVLAVSLVARTLLLRNKISND